MGNATKKTTPMELTVGETAHHAKQLLENPVFDLVFKSIERDLLSEWRNTDYDQSVLRETVWARIKGVEYVKQKLEGCIKIHLLKQQSGDKPMV